MSDVIIGVDLGGTRVRVARLNHRLEILSRHETLTHADEGLEATLTRIKQQIRSALPTDGTAVAGIGISAPGPLNPTTGVIVAPPNLPGWHNVPLGDILYDEFDIPVYTGNDANVAVLAETVHGASRGFRHVIFITISTGIGSGFIVDGKLLLGKEGLAAEAGHVVILAGERVSTLEKEAAGPALARQARARIQAGESSVMHAMVNGNLSKIDGAVVGHAAQQGDALALDIVRYGGRIVGLGIASLLHLFNPEIVVLGGGVSQLGDLLFDPLRKAVETYTIDDAYWRDLQIVPAGLGENVSIVGAGALVATRGGVEDITEVAAKIDAED
ncbi:MAG: ROK family protein [Anaerolineaceae bacterium]|nr:ROK family protein [Anaerolineaceae bacterium]